MVFKVTLLVHWWKLRQTGCQPLLLRQISSMSVVGSEGWTSEGWLPLPSACRGRGGRQRTWGPAAYVVLACPTGRPGFKSCLWSCYFDEASWKTFMSWHADLMVVILLRKYLLPNCERPCLPYSFSIILYTPSHVKILVWKLRIMIRQFMLLKAYKLYFKACYNIVNSFSNHLWTFIVLFLKSQE